MKMAPLDIVDGSYSDEDKSFSAQDTVNYLPTSAEQNGTRTPTMLRTPPGLKPAVAIGVNDGGFTLAGPVRGTYNAEGRFFAVAGNTLFQITTNGVSIPLGTVPGVGRVSFSHNQITNGNEILVNNGNAGYIYNTVTQIFQRITDTSYPGGLRAVFINNRFVQIEPARRYLFNSALADGLSYNALDRFTSETSPDLVMGIESIGNQLAVFSSTTTEWFEDTGATNQPFRSTGIVADKGAAGPFATAKMDNQLFFLADDGVFYRYQGYNPVRISTKPIEQAIRNKNWFNVFTTVWEDSGYAVCYWTFPDGQTWGYDASTNKWHRRESYGFNRWRLNSLTYWQNKWHGGDFQRGHLWELDWDYILEGDQEFESIRACGVIADSQNRVIHQRLEAVMNTGMVETVPIAFGEQPVGPSITGTPPSGSVGVAYAGYTFTTTPGDAPIARTIILSGTLPPGLSWNQNTATISTGTPTTTGLYTLTLRTIDTNGLYADLDVEIPIATVMMALYFTSSPTDDSWLISGGLDWSGNWTAEADIQNKTFITGTLDSFVVHGTTGFPAYTQDFGATWNLSTGSGQSGVGGILHGWYSKNSDAMMIPQGLNEFVTVSVDSGQTFQDTALQTANCVVAVEVNGVTRWITGNLYGDPFQKSEDNGATATNVGVPAGMTGGVTGWAHEDTAWFGAGAGGAPAIWATTGDGTYTPQTLPTLSGTVILGMGGGVIDEKAYVLAWTNIGELIFRNPDSGDWALSADQPDGIPDSAGCNGAVLAITINKNNVSDNEGIISTSTDADSWTERRRQTIGNTEFFRGITALVEA